MNAAAKLQPQSIWDKGHYERVGSKLVIVAEQLCETSDLKGGSLVLDVAAGHGNAALAAARRECEVSAVDNVESLLSLGNQRAAIEGLPINFKQSDMHNLPFEQNSFDFVLSTFGVQFASDPLKAGSELMRVCRPGGKIALANWSATGFTEQYNAILAPWMPKQPSTIKSPFIWGTEQGVREYLGNGIESLHIYQREFRYRFAGVNDWFECFKTTYGPVKSLYESLSSSDRAELTAKVNEVVNRFNCAKDNSLVLPINYIEAVIVKS